MSNVINKKTLEYIESAHTPDYPVKDWIIDPVLPDCERKYWKIEGGHVVEMDELEKLFADEKEAEEIKAQKEWLANRLK
jgi:hypothetical protein